MPLLNATPENIEDLKMAVDVTYADDDAPIYEDNPEGVGEARVASLKALLASGPTWKPMKSSADLPLNTPVLLRADFLPRGFRVGDGMGTLGYRSVGAGAIWTLSDDVPFRDEGDGLTTAIFTHFAEIPAFDGESA